MKNFHERNHYLLNHTINKKFEQILWMTDAEFRVYVKALRKVIVDIWDNKNTPPRTAYDEPEIVEQFNQLMGYPVHEFECIDEKTGERDCIRNIVRLGTTCVNQWFPHMLKTRICTQNSGQGTSIYDFNAKKEFFESHYKALYRNLKKDSFYHYSTVVEKNNTKFGIFADTAKEWITKFENQKRQYNTHDYFISEKELDEVYTGNNLDVRNKVFLELLEDSLLELLDIIPKKCLSNIDINKIKNGNKKYQIRYFPLDQKLFPMAFKSWKVSVIQQPVNFPVLTAKWLYEKYTEDFKNDDTIYIWDCSSGWGGRILGAMSCRNDRNLHYIGNDPNTDNWITPEHSRYEDLANYYNENSNRLKCLFPQSNTYEVYCLGSEVMKDNINFQKYKGKISLAGTSCPYFNREQYSDDETQSYLKFKTYTTWRDGFLRITLETINEWLRPGGYCWWNVADLRMPDGTYLPLEKDSFNILSELGMKHITTWKMCLHSFPGAGRTDAAGESTFKNYCKINGKRIWHE